MSGHQRVSNGEAELELILRRVYRVVNAVLRREGEAMVAPRRSLSRRSLRSGSSLRRSPEVTKICGEAASRVRRIEKRFQDAQGDFDRARIPEDTEWWLHSIVNRMIPRLGRLHRADVDLVVGCLARVEHAARSTLPSMNRLRSAAQPYLRGIH
jgi:hypothetical protein